MNNWLVKHARSNVWQVPGECGILTVSPKRISSPSGTVGIIVDAMTSVPLPEAGVWYHVFHIGKLHKVKGNLNIPSKIWTKLTNIVNYFNCWWNVYSVDGISIPTEHCWVYKLENGLVLLAIAENKKYSWVKNDDVYLRIYPGYDATHEVEFVYKNVSTNNEKQNIYDKYISYKNIGSGYVTLLINGIVYKEPKLNDIKITDEVEVRYDGRVRRYVDFNCGELSTFTSTLDDLRKYLLHIPKSDRTWNFAEDIEIEVYFGNVGRYYRQHLALDIRQLTYNDFTIPAKRITEVLTYFDGIKNIDDLVIRLIIREGFGNRKVIFSNDRIHELYKLDDKLIVNAILGTSKSIDEWRGANLEQSLSNRLAYSKFENINKKVCTKAYGYNAVSFYVANTPTKLISDNGNNYCYLPDMLATFSTIYEYDKYGKLLNYYRHKNSTSYTAKNPLAVMVEGLVSSGDTSLDITYGSDDFTLEENVNYSFHLQRLSNGINTNEIIEPVLGEDYTINNNVVSWNVDTLRRLPIIISDKKHLFFTKTVKRTRGDLKLAITVDYGGNDITSYVPMETVEAWINGYPLVHGIDYHVNWPEVCIINKTFLLDDDNVIAIRCRGVSKELRIPQHGFVTESLFSNNDFYDVKDDKVVRIVAGGQLLHRDDIVFREDNLIGTDKVADGFPYSIDDPTVPLRDWISDDTYNLRDLSRDLDKRIEDYMTSVYPTPPVGNVVRLPSWYHLYSPTLNKIIMAYLDGNLHLVEDDTTHRISTEQLDAKMTYYGEYLKFDPAYLGYDDRYVKVHPHYLYKVVEVSELCFAFLDRVNASYLNGRVQLNQYIKIKEPV